MLSPPPHQTLSFVVYSGSWILSKQESALRAESPIPPRLLAKPGSPGILGQLPTSSQGKPRTLALAHNLPKGRLFHCSPGLLCGLP